MKPYIYDLGMNRLGSLMHATKVGYKHVINDLYTASFSLPVMDEANELCENPHAIVDIFDGDCSAGKYRIADEPEEEITGTDALYTYSCEHVLAFLFDDRIDGYLEIGGTGVYTQDVIEHLLSLQTVKRWKLGRCDFRYQFQYAWENEDILNALFAIPKCFADEYRWTYDTDSYPWTISLVRRDTERGCEIRCGRNQQEIKRSRDVSTLCTRLYCLGSGEGVNQTGIRSVNPTGKSYIESVNAGKYGVISKLLVDKSISDETTLFAKGQAYLKALENPQYSYSVKAADLYRMTGLDWDRIDEGKLVHVADDRLNQDFDRYIVSFSKADVDGDPLDADVVISGKTEDVSSAIEDISAKAAITAQYAQGATNLFPMQVMDNADAAHPAKLRFFVPQTCVKINACLLSWQLSPFRAYETGAAAGGGVVSTTLDGGGSTQTSSAGGQTVITVEQRTAAQTLHTGNPLVEGEAKNETGYALNADGTHKSYTAAATGSTSVSGEQNTGVSRNAGGAMSSTGTGGPTSTGTGGPSATGAARNGDGAMSTTGAWSGDSGESSGSTGSGGSGISVQTLSGNSGYTDGSGSHRHVISHTHSLSGASHTHSLNSHSHSIPSHTHSMSHWHSLDTHSHTISQHSHSMSHWHTIDGHTHGLGGHTHEMDHRHEFAHAHLVVVSAVVPSQQIQIQAHSHTVSVPSHSHSFTLISHTHDIVYGIYEGGMASSVSILVDGNEVPDGEVSGSEIDVIPYMAKDSSGRITRGTWHEISLVPDKLTRIEADLFVQTFITSYAGGAY